MPQSTDEGMQQIFDHWHLYSGLHPEQRPIQALLNMVRDEYGTIPNVSWLWNMSEETIIGRMTDVLYPQEVGNE